MRRDGVVESEDHLFTTCEIFNWVGSEVVLPGNITTLLEIFALLAPKGKGIK